MDSPKLKQLSVEMTAFCRKAVEQTQKQSSQTPPKILTVVLVALAVGIITPDRSSFWDAAE